MKINDWAKKIHRNAICHGFWDESAEPSFPEVVALCHSELSEALEADRKGEPLFWVREVDGKPEGAAVEMVDCIIRILDWCAAKDIDVEGILESKTAFNALRPKKHGKRY